MRRLCSCFALIGAALFAAGLRAEEPAFSWGLKAGWAVRSGATLKDVSIKNPDGSSEAGLSQSSRTGFMGGVFAEARLSAPFSVQLETFYAQKRFTVSAANASVTYHLNTVELPLTLKATFGSEAFRPYVFAGPNLGLRVSVKADKNSGNVVFDDQTKSADLALDMGGGFLYRLNAGTSLLLDARYSLGLVNSLSGPLSGDFSKAHDIKILTGVRFAFR